jgi:hypothetical protein
MRTRLALIAIGFLTLYPALSDTTVEAWSMEIHRMITRRALDGLPAPLRQFYAPHKEFVVEHSVDPDLWRVVGLRTELGPEDPNHFLDIDALDEPPPFTGVPRDWNAYLARYGEARVNQAGRLPWRMVDVFDRMVAAFKEYGSGTRPYAAENARYLSAVIAHYVEDSAQPFHAVANYDGQLTNQRGIHSRFEAELARRYWTRITHRPVAIEPIPDVKAYTFANLVEGHRLTQRILDADRKIAGEGRRYDANYYAQMFAETKDILELRLNASANGVASLIVQAWTNAGKPNLSPAPAAR